MTQPSYTSGTVITAGHYNYLATGSTDGTLTAGVPSVGLLWGPGFAEYGYGQDTTYIAPVQPGDSITKNEWNNLDAILSHVRNHQLGPNTYNGEPMVEVGDTIIPRTLNVPNTVAAFENAGKSYTTNDIDTQASVYSGFWGVNAKQTLKLIHRVSFTTADAARWFFNAGGKFKLSYSNVKGAGVGVQTPRSIFWTDMCRAVGSIQIGYKNTLKIDNLPGDFYGQADNAKDQNNGGFWAHKDRGTEEIIHYTQDYISYGWQYGYGYDQRYGYGSYYGRSGLKDYMTVSMRILDNDGLNGNLGRTIEVISTFYNGTSAPTTPAGAPMGDFNDEINSTITATLTVAEPPYVPNGFLQERSWGNWVVIKDYALSGA